MASALSDLVSRGVELPSRIVFALVRPAVRIARRFHFSMNHLQDLVAMAYVDELRRTEGLTNAEIASAIGKSKRTVGNLLAAYNSDFLRPHDAVQNLRELEGLIQKGTTSLPSLADATGLTESQLQTAVRLLSEMGRIRIDDRDGEQRFAASEELSSWVTDAVESKIDGLEHQMNAISSAVYDSFFRDKGERHSTTRTYGFVATEKFRQAIGERVVTELRALVSEAEEEVAQVGSGDNYLMAFTITLDERDR